MSEPHNDALAECHLSHGAMLAWLAARLTSEQERYDVETEYLRLSVPADFGLVYVAALVFGALAIGIGVFNTLVVGRKIFSRLTHDHGWTHEDIHGPRHAGPSVRQRVYTKLVHNGGHTTLGDGALSALCVRAKRYDYVAGACALLGILLFLLIALLDG